jgi:L-proline amide hydrolase
MSPSNPLTQKRNGPSEFFVSGTLKTWTIEPQIHKINVETLLVNGKYDEAQDEVLEPFFRGIGKVKWVRFAESSHMPHLEEEGEFLRVLGDFLLA